MNNKNYKYWIAYKIFADIFESLIASVLIDSGKDLDAVEKVINKLINEDIRSNKEGECEE